MKRKHSLVKALLVILVFVAAGLVYSCSRSGSGAEAEALYGQDGTEGIFDPESGSAEIIETQPEETETVPQTEPLICVFVCGQVMRPGVYYIEGGARIHEVIDLAGGLTVDAAFEYVNLADRLTDGMELYIPSVSEIEAAQGDSKEAFPGRSAPYGYPGSGSVEMSSEDSEDDGRIDINKASLEELMTLPGIGKSKAEAIISYRENVGRFETTGDIEQVSGIKDSTYSRIKDYIKVQ